MIKFVPLEKNVVTFIMFKKALNILKYLAFLGVGVFVFWWVYKDEPVSIYKEAFKNLNYWWIAVSVLLNIFSQISRAMRWNMLIRPMGYKPKLYNSYFAVVLLYFVNLILPRAGEVFRCTILTRYEKIPFAKLAGTVFVERMADFITLMILAFIIILSQFGVFVSFFNSHEDVKQNLLSLFSARNIIIGFAVLFSLILILILFNRYFRKKDSGGNSFLKRFRLIRQNFVTGIKSVAMLENKWLFIGHTAFIFIMWLFMLYVIFLAFGPTSQLSILTGMITFLMGGLAMLAPVQGGIGPWHFMVYETLFIYGIDKADGKIFALIAHSSTNLIYLFLGIAAFAILPIINRPVKEPTTEKAE
ncbi:MAG TPA: lysylphosphatidylglycerol synthase transmembrane domain-containing protein [Bacteroidales bacterium]|nr:lysylphosphatidylglycerol synthase transmembrane domain-containing protein [Bacteroidales bacterium]